MGTKNPYFASLTCIYCFVISMIAIPETVLSSKLEQLLEKGTQELVAGKFAEALSIYSEAVDEEPNNFLPYYKRATALLASGKTRSAIPDLDKVLELKPDYHLAFKTRGNALIKMGELEKAKSDFTKLMPFDPNTAQSSIELIKSLEFKIDEARHFVEADQLVEALPLLNSIMETVNLNKDLFEWRARCHLRTGDHQRGIQDLRHGVHLINDNRKGLLDISVMMYEYGLAVQSLEEIRECLRLDQDDKACHKHYKMIKKLAKAITDAQDASDANNYQECITKAQTVLKLEPEREVYKNQADLNLCHCMAQNGDPNGVEFCQRVNEKHPSVSEYMLDLATAHLNRDEVDEAIKLYQKILETDRNNRQAQEGMEKAQRMKKNQSRRDYYKILNVKKNASKKEITKAYRKLAAEWHPDRFEEKDKKMAEKKFIDITDAKEVLTDEEKRRQFDMGIDPLDPEQAAGGGGHPGGGHPFHFHSGGGGFGGFHGFNPFEHGNGNFEFHFGG